MAGDKYLKIASGVIGEQAAVQSSAGAGSAGKIVALDAGGKLDNTMLPAGVGAETKELEASEALSAGNWVNVWNDSGTAKVRKADATAAGKEANGFVLAAFDSAATATVYVAGINNQLSALTPGAVYFLDTTAGSQNATAPSGSGNIVQKVWRSLSATEIAFEPSDPVTLA